MAGSTFIFDIVIKRIDLEDCKLQNVEGLVVAVKCNNFSLNINSDRKSPLDFRAGGSSEFDAFPELLALEMQLFPIHILVLYQDNEIGCCKVKWPDNLIDKVDETMDDIIHYTKCQLENEQKSVGRIEILLRLRIKTKFPSLCIKDCKKDKDLETLLEKGDTFFVLSEREKQCLHSDSDEDSIEEWSTPSVLTGCPLHKNGSVENFKAPFDSHKKFEKKNVFKKCDRMNKITKRKISSENCFAINKTNAGCPGRDDCFKAAGDSVFSKAPGKKPRILGAGPIPKCCPTCKTDVSWLPELIPCPVCGYICDSGNKNQYNSNLTAEEVLNIFASTCKDDSSDDCRENGQNVNEEKKAKNSKKKCKYTRAQTDDRRRSKNKQKECDARLIAYIKSLLPPKEDKHFKCQHGYKPVPPNMGWMWNLMATGKNRNWRPGAIRKPIRELMSWFLTDFPADTIPISKYAGYRRKELTRKSDICQEKLVQEPTLHILKKKAEYILTMRPLKNNDDLQHAVNPYVEMQPIQFKIIKNPELIAFRNIKRKIKDMGFSSCICGRPVSKCICHSHKDQMEINRIVQNECCEQGMAFCKDTFIFSDVTESESEIDFAVTPPVGRLKLENLCKPDKTDVGTQYDITDWKLAPRLTINSALMRLCRKKRKQQLSGLCAFSKCPQNIQPPIIIPKVEKTPKEPKKGKYGKKGKGEKKKKK